MPWTTPPWILPGGEQRVGRAAVVNGDMVEDLDHPGISGSTSRRQRVQRIRRRIEPWPPLLPAGPAPRYGSMLPILPVRIGACEGKAHAGCGPRRCKVYT